MCIDADCFSKLCLVGDGRKIDSVTIDLLDSVCTKDMLKG